MAHGNSAINSSPEGLPEGPTAGGDQAQLKTHNILQGYAAENMGDLSPGPKGSAPSSPSARTFGADRGDGTPHVPAVAIAMLDGDTTTAPGKARAAVGEASPDPKPTAEEYKRGTTLGFGGRKIPIYDYRDTIPSISKTYDPSTGVLKETFPKECGIKDPMQKYGGVVLDRQISQTVAFRGEKMRECKDGPQLCKTIDLKNMQGISGYGSGELGGTGETPIHSVEMWQERIGTNAQGQPVYESKQKAVIDKVDWKGNPVIDKKTGKPELETREQPMLNDDFNRQYEDLDPDKLAQYAPKTGDEKVAETEQKSDKRNPRPAIY